MKISIVDYGMGNIRSVANAFHYWGKTVEVINKPDEILAAKKLVLPGVGSFFQVITFLNQLNLQPSLHEAVLEKKTPILGICLGMQVMATHGEEGGETTGLGWIEGKVTPLFKEASYALALPHIGFNGVKNEATTSQVLGEEQSTDYYFCHGYQLKSVDPRYQFGYATYGEEFIASIEYQNIWGTQFHPEKSQANGLALIKRFIDYRA